MATITFDTLACSENMQKAGFTREQVDAMAKANAQAIENIISINELVTKSDLKIALAETKHEILKWMVTAMMAQTALLVGIIAILR